MGWKNKDKESRGQDKGDRNEREQNGGLNRKGKGDVTMMMMMLGWVDAIFNTRWDLGWLFGR